MEAAADAGRIVLFELVQNPCPIGEATFSEALRDYGCRPNAEFIIVTLSEFYKSEVCKFCLLFPRLGFS